MITFASYIGIPFRERGRDRTGLDCWGLVRLILWEVFEVATGDFDDYNIDHREDCARIVRRESVTPEWLKVGTPEIGDIVLLRINGHPMHCGVYVGHGQFIHASHGIGVCIERLNSTAWSRRIAGFFRHRDMVREAVAHG